MKVKYYTVYLKKNDGVVVAGTARECAKQMKCSLGSFHSLISRARKGLI